MIMRPVRFGVAMGLAVLVGLAIAVYGFANGMAPRRSPAEERKPARPWEVSRTTTPDGHPVPLTPLVPIGRTPNPVVEEPLGIRFLKAPWAPIVCGFVVFNVASLLFRDRIVLDRRGDVLVRRGCVVCPLSDVVGVEIDDTPRLQVMNDLALILKDNARFSLMLYDGSADSGLHAAAETIAIFLEVPVKTKKDYSLFRPKPK